MAQAGIHTVADLARRMGIKNRQTVHRWLSGEGKHPEPEFLFKLADALKVNARWLALGPPHSPLMMKNVNTEQAELLAISDALPQKAREQWLSQGRGLVEIMAPQSAANPYPATSKQR